VFLQRNENTDMANNGAISNTEESNEKFKSETLVLLLLQIFKQQFK